MASDLVERLRPEAAMLREIAKSEARGIDWQENLNAGADALIAAADALAARDAEIAECHENINLKADFIDATLNQLAERDAEIVRLKALLEEAEQRGREQERAAVVAWLRGKVTPYPESAGYSHAADAIEAEEHLK